MVHFNKYYNFNILTQPNNLHGTSYFKSSSLCHHLVYLQTCIICTYTLLSPITRYNRQKCKVMQAFGRDMQIYSK